MKNLTPYIIIIGKCEDALSLYCDAFNGKVRFSQKYSETEYDVSEYFEEKK